MLSSSLQPQACPKPLHLQPAIHPWPALPSAHNMVSSEEMTAHPPRLLGRCTPWFPHNAHHTPGITVEGGGGMEVPD
ncbi:unnamed protein product [Arctogadus glacialis]